MSTTPTPSLETATIDTPSLTIAYHRWAPADVGQTRGAPVVCVHGFPDDARSWHDTAALLAAAECDVIAPYLRGFGPSAFHSDDTPRSGQLAALAQDLLDLLDALEVEQATLVGQDWGARACQAVAAVAPDRVERLVSVGGYALTWDGSGPPSYDQVQALWYQFLLQLGWGEGVLRADATGFARHLWRIWSPTWGPEAVIDAAFNATAESFANPAFVDVVLSAYRDDPNGNDIRHAQLEARLAKGPTIGVPTVLLHGADDGIEPDGPDHALDAERFTDLLTVASIDGAGHFLHRERPDVIANAVLRSDGELRRGAMAGSMAQ